MNAEHFLRAAEEEREKRRRARRVAVIEIPTLRLAGSALLALGVFLHNRFLLGAPDAAAAVRVAFLLGAWCALSWLVVAALHGRVAFDVSLATLVVDIAVWTVAIYESGAERSWLFFILFLRVADQAQTRFRRALGFVLFNTFCYAAMLVYVILGDGRPLPDALALTKVAFVFAGGLYIALATRGFELRRMRLGEAIRMSRELIARLEAQSVELADARGRAEAASAAKSEFLANMSHEMRTPLHGLIGMLQLAIDSETNRERARQLELARRSADALLATIGDILDFSKIEAQKLELEPVYFSIRQLVADALKAMGVTAAEKGLILAFCVSPEVPDRLWGDPLRLRQVLTNLAGNAIKFTNEGEVTVRVTCEAMAFDRVTVGFAVRDTGIGVDPSRRHVIFDPFAQADSSQSRRYGGSGLGLAIVRRLLEAMQGVITFESEPGRGSTFRFTVPMPCEPVATAQPPAWERSLAGMRVLLIEPNAASRAMLVETMRAHGLVPEPYATLDVALQPSIRAAYACVVADASILANTPWLPPVPVVRIASPLVPFFDETTVTRPVGERELIDAVGLALRVTDSAVAYTLERRVTGTRPLRVLVVDDNEVNQEFAAEAVRRLGNVATCASGGAEALELLRERTFDAVLLDVQMPEIDGFEVARRYRVRERGARTPLVAVTALTTDEEHERCIAAGFDAVLTKPATPSSLAATLAQFSGAHPPAPAPSSTSPLDGILNAVGGNVRLLARVRDAFATQTPRLLDALHVALTARDGDALFRNAHTLKGAISNFDVPEAVEAAIELERAAQSAQFDIAAELLPRIESAVRELEERIDAALA